MQKSAVQLKIEAQLQASVDLLKQAKRYVGQSNTIGGQDLSREITEFVASVDRNPRVPPPYAPDSGPALFVERCEQIGSLAVKALVEPLHDPLLEELPWLPVAAGEQPEECDHYMKVLAEDGTKCFCYHCGVDLTNKS